jgi:hypothetical protein
MTSNDVIFYAVIAQGRVVDWSLLADIYKHW